MTGKEIYKINNWWYCIEISVGDSLTCPENDKFEKAILINKNYQYNIIIIF